MILKAMTGCIRAVFNRFQSGARLAKGREASAFNFALTPEAANLRVHAINVDFPGASIRALRMKQPDIPSAINSEWVEAIRHWAANESLIEAAYLFGSRVKGTHRFDSDLDVAIIVAGGDDGERLGNAISCMSNWIAVLQPQLSVSLDLRSAMDDDTIVMPAVHEHGILIFDRRAS